MDKTECIMFFMIFESNYLVLNQSLSTLHENRRLTLEYIPLSENKGYTKNGKLLIYFLILNGPCKFTFFHCDFLTIRFYYVDLRFLCYLNFYQVVLEIWKGKKFV